MHLPLGVRVRLEPSSRVDVKFGVVGPHHRFATALQYFGLRQIQMRGHCRHEHSHDLSMIGWECELLALKVEEHALVLVVRSCRPRFFEKRRKQKAPASDEGSPSRDFRVRAIESGNLLTTGHVDRA